MTELTLDCDTHAPVEVGETKMSLPDILICKWFWNVKMITAVSNVWDCYLMFNI